MGEIVAISMAVCTILLIVGMSVNGIVDKLVQAKRIRYEAENAPGGHDIRAIAERQQMIEERLRVLERIATDRGIVLADEIEALRRDIPALAPAQRQTEDAAQ